MSWIQFVLWGQFFGLAWLIVSGVVGPQWPNILILVLFFFVAAVASISPRERKR